MSKILPNVKKRQGSATINLYEPGIYEKYVRVEKAFKEQVEKRIEEGKKGELEAEKRIKDIIINY